MNCSPQRKKLAMGIYKFLLGDGEPPELSGLCTACMLDVFSRTTHLTSLFTEDIRSIIEPVPPGAPSDGTSQFKQ